MNLDQVVFLSQVQAVIAGLVLASVLAGVCWLVGRLVRLSRSASPVWSASPLRVRGRGRVSMPGRSCRGVVLGGGL